MKRRFRVTLIMAVAIAVAAPASSQTGQAPARDTARPQTGTSRIRGRIVAADTGAPVRRAIVRLSAPELRESRSKMTDADGKYEFVDLPAGTYSIFASKTGFVSAALGASPAEQMPKPVKVEEAKVATADEVVLTRACAIAGRVVDEFGDPVAGTQVNVLRSQSLGGVRRMMPANGSSTNDLGQFRAFGLQPGTYFVSVRPSMGNEAESEDHLGYAPTYYPSTANVSDAQPVQVSAGQDVTGIEIMLATVRVGRISGTALDSRGRLAANSSVTVMLLDGGMGFAGPSSFGRVLQDGTFTINNIPPGDYLLEVRVAADVASTGAPPAPARAEYGRMRVTVAGGDVSGVMIQASAGATVSGQVVFDGGSPPARTAVTVMAASPPAFGPVFSAGPTGPPAKVGADGTFVLTGVFGDRVFRVGGQPPGWIVKAIYVNGRDVIDTPITLDGRENVTGVQIVLTDHITHVTGSVNDESGQPAATAYVLVSPDDPARMTAGSRFQRTAVVRAGSPLKIDGLPAGEYTALALKSLPREFDPYDPDFFQYLRKVGTRFSLRDGETRNLTLRLVEPPAK